ncbi:unnamed protein product [Bursaphelenchus okinawaensis]|uniref:Uncharacterized protein n=1 Tax=Bursaphelenchus okinawaensis TaxID=465554 RepID=A0A811L5V2_9BILA|nr:unnamed protein product [Bursaphelenchus okinawaensis]CAG9117208.1 unnamed protein product [Bursaphelenchus okinawaensis]
MKSLIIISALLAVAFSAEFKVGGKVRCKLDGASGRTTGIAQLWEHDVDPDDHMGEVALKDNKFSGLHFSETEVFGEVEPYVQVFHDCHPDIRKDSGHPAKSGCRAVSNYHFSPPQGSDEIWVEFDLETTLESQLKCDGASRLHPNPNTTGEPRHDVGVGHAEE